MTQRWFLVGRVIVGFTPRPFHIAMQFSKIPKDP